MTIINYKSQSMTIILVKVGENYTLTYSSAFATNNKIYTYYFKELNESCQMAQALLMSEE